jgi:hypothetical protein
MCNSKNHSYGCSCGFGGAYHRGRRRASTQIKTQEDIFFERYPELRNRQSAAICFVKPNAKCPKCGHPVYYFQNEFGSRVFFDDLGPPWPKHPCTDRLNSYGQSIQFESRLQMRCHNEVVEIMSLENPKTFNLKMDVLGTHGTKSWNVATISKRIKSNALVFIVAKLQRLGGTKNVYFSCKSLPKSCKGGLVIMIGNRKISYIDPVTLNPVTFTAVRYRGAKAFVDALIRETIPT